MLDRLPLVDDEDLFGSSVDVVAVDVIIEQCSEEFNWEMYRGFFFLVNFGGPPFVPVLVTTSTETLSRPSTKDTRFPGDSPPLTLSRCFGDTTDASVDDIKIG